MVQRQYLKKNRCSFFLYVKDKQMKHVFFFFFSLLLSNNTNHPHVNLPYTLQEKNNEKSLSTVNFIFRLVELIIPFLVV